MNSPVPPPRQDAYLERGTVAYWRASAALLAAGYATFSLLYYVQPLLPAFSHDFGVTPAQSSLSLSLTTGMLALAIFIAGFVSESWSRRGLMASSLLVSATLTAIVAVAPEWHQLLILRTLEGLALGGVPAVAMAYLAEEVHPSSLGFAMGLYVGGTAIGGMSGRVITGVLTDLFSWRVAVGGIAGLGLLATLAFWLLLPPSRRFVPRRGVGFSGHREALLSHFSQPGLISLFLMAFLLMGSFVTLYNYIGYHLLGAPYFLSQSSIGAIFVVYLVGTIASPGSGRLADQFGRGPVLSAGVVIMLVGASLTLLRPLVLTILGIGLITLGFFAAHAVASSWVGRLAKRSKGQASALYLLAYYLGSSLVGSYGGHWWALAGWPGVVALVGALLLVALGVAVRLSRLERAALRPN